MSKEKKPAPKKSTAIEIVHVKLTRKTVFIKWTQGENERTLNERDEPLPSFRAAFSALPSLVGTVCHFPAKWTDEGVRVTELHVGTKGGVATASLTARKDLDDASKEFAFTTPERLLEMPTEEGAYSPPLCKDDAALILDAISEAKLYVRGDRSQTQIQFDDGKDDDEAEGGEGDQTGDLPLGENATGKVVKPKGDK